MKRDLGNATTRSWFVDPEDGDDANDGLDPSRPLRTYASWNMKKQLQHGILRRAHCAWKGGQTTACLMVMILVAGCKTGTVKETHTMPADVNIRVTNEVVNPVSGLLFGQFLEKPSWGGETGVEAAVLPGTHRLDPRVEEMLQNMEIPVVRFPGGTDVDYLDWRDMVSDAHGPGSGRPDSKSHRKGKEPIITNAFGYDEYFQLAGRLGWKSILVVNLRDGLLGGKTPAAAAEHAAALLAYCTGEVATLPEPFRQWPALRAANGHLESYPVEYVQIGNEAWWSEAMQKKHGADWIKAWADTIEIYIATLRRIAPGIRVIVDAYPLEISAELSRRKAGVDLYALHRYYPMGINGLHTPGGEILPTEKAAGKQVWETLVHSTETDSAGLAQWQDKAIDQARSLGMKLAMTEWNLNGFWQIKERGELWPGPGGCGLGAAVMLNALLRRGDVIELATQSMLVGKAWGIAGIRVTKDGDTAPVYVPTAEVTTLYNKLHGNRRLQVHYDTQLPLWKPDVCFDKQYRVTEQAAPVDVVATRDDRNLYLHVLNTDYDRQRRLAVRLEGLPVAGVQATFHRLRFLTRGETTPDGPWTGAETGTLTVRQDGIDVQLPERSATILVIPLR